LVLRSLDLARTGKLTILLAPPGYGKTTVLGQWWSHLGKKGIRAAWYTASELDREPDVFLRMVAGALTAAGFSLQDVADQNLDRPISGLLDAVLLELGQSVEPVVLIIDDFDRVEQPAVKRVIEDLVDAWPDTIHLVLATRRKPSLALSMLRAQGLIRVIDAAELRLTSEELAQIFNLSVGSPELSTIAELTEGWPVAAQLYRLWRMRKEGGGDTIRFNGREDEVAEYLAEQIFATLSWECQELLSDLSLFDHVEPAMADHVRERVDSSLLFDEVQAALPALVQQTKFEGEAAYRFHPLISDYAQGRLLRSPGREASLRARASEWLWSHQRYAAAVRHLNRADERALLLDKLKTLEFLPVFMTFGAGELRSILREIPPDMVELYPRLQLMATLAQFKAGYHGQAYDWLKTIGERTGCFTRDPAGCDEDLEREGHALAALFEGSVRGPTQACEDHVERLRGLSGGRPLMWAWCENLMIVVHEMRGNLAAARQCEIRTRETYRALGLLPFAEYHLVTHNILIAMAEGDLRSAGQIAGTALRQRSADEGAEPIVSGMARIALAAIDYIRHYHEGAGDMLRFAFDQFGEGDSWFDQYAIAWPILADIAWRRDGREGVTRVTTDLRNRLHGRGIESVDTLLLAIDTIYAARDNDLASAELLSSRLDPERPLAPWREADLAQQAHIQLALAADHPAAAIERAAALVREGRRSGRQETTIKALVLLARAHDASDDAESADAIMRQAIGEAYAQEVIAPFAEEGTPVFVILQRLAGLELHPWEQLHVEAVLKIFRSAPGCLPDDTLTEREAEIVAHLAQGASNKLIARRLGLTENTIKFHLRKVYAKLGVSSRKAAVARFLKGR
jgi:LuxR family maltose regulon positive regulatory protein